MPRGVNADNLIFKNDSSLLCLYTNPKPRAEKIFKNNITNLYEVEKYLHQLGLMSKEKDIGRFLFKYLDIVKEKYGKTSEHYLLANIRLMLFLVAKRNIANMEELFDKAFQEISDNNILHRAILYDYYALWRVKQGRPRKSIDMWKKSIGLLTKIDNRDYLMIVYRNLLNVYILNNNKKEIESTLKTIEEISREYEGMEMVDIYNAASHYYYIAGEYNESGKLAQRAIDHMEQKKHIYDLRIMDALNIQAFSYMAIGYFDRAKSVFARALITQSMGIKFNHQYLPFIYYGLGKVQEAEQEKVAAMSSFESAMNAMRDLNFSSDSVLKKYTMQSIEKLGHPLKVFFDAVDTFKKENEKFVAGVKNNKNLDVNKTVLSKIEKIALAYVEINDMYIHALDTLGEPASEKSLLDYIEKNNLFYLYGILGVFVEKGPEEKYKLRSSLLEKMKNDFKHMIKSTKFPPEWSIVHSIYCIKIYMVKKNFENSPKPKKDCREESLDDFVKTMSRYKDNLLQMAEYRPSKIPSGRRMYYKSKSVYRKIFLKKYFSEMLLAFKESRSNQDMRSFFLTINKEMENIKDMEPINLSFDARTQRDGKVDALIFITFFKVVDRFCEP